MLPAFFKSFYKYRPVDGLVRPKLVANIGNIKIKDSFDRRTVHIAFHFSVVE
jgi:hypothetical protein